MGIGLLNNVHAFLVDSDEILDSGIMLPAFVLICNSCRSRVSCGFCVFVFIFIFPATRFGKLESLQSSKH